MTESMHLACEPIAKPDWLQGNVVVYAFTAEFVRWILDMRQHTEQVFCGRSSYAFCRAYFQTKPGHWFHSIDLPEGMEFDGEWLELVDAGELPDFELTHDSVLTECWTIGIGVSDILFHFCEQDVAVAMETPEIPYTALEALLRSLTPMTASTSEVKKP